MNARMPARLAGWDQMGRDRLERLRAEARDERLARAARAARPSSPRRTNRLGFVVRLAGAGTTGGTNR
jgi:hypothetical protein